MSGSPHSLEHSVPGVCGDGGGGDGDGGGGDGCGGGGDGGGGGGGGGAGGGGVGGGGAGGGGGDGDSRSAVLGHAPPCWLPLYPSGMKYVTPPNVCVCVVPPGATLWAWTSLVKRGK